MTEPVTPPIWQQAPPPPPPAPEPAPEPEAPAPVHAPGDLVAYTHHDDYASPPTDRHQVVLVVAVAGDGRVFGVPIAYADQLATFDAAGLVPLDEL
jgi:hypothetical protein